MKTLYIILMVAAALIISPAFLYLIQSTVCEATHEHMHTAGDYNIFTGCTTDVEVEKGVCQGEAC